MQGNTRIYGCSSIDGGASMMKKDLDEFENLHLQLYNSTKMLIAKGVSLWPNTNVLPLENKVKIVRLAMYYFLNYFGLHTQGFS